MTRQSKSQIRALSFAERWLNDCLLVSRQPAFHQAIEVDVSGVEALIKDARDRGLHLTYTHVLVHAAALALSAHPDLHRMLAGNRVQSFTHVDIALSVGDTFAVVPTMIIQSADEKPLDAIAGEVIARLPEVRKNYRKLLAVANSWGWLVPFGFMRRAILRLMFHSFRYRRNGAGTLQISVANNVDVFATPIFNTAAILTAGRVKDRPLAVNGVATVRPTIFLSCSADHRLWNGQDCQTFLNAIGDLIASGRFGNENLCEAAVPGPLQGAARSSDAPRSGR